MSVFQKSRHMIIAGAMATVAVIGADQAQALTIDSWTQITNNGNTNIASQLSTDVTDIGGSQVKFHFTNAVGVASAITDIYFDDKTVSVLGSIFSITGSAGVSYSNGANPANLPGGNDIGFSADFSMQPSNPANGINAAGEYLDVVFNLTGGKTFADVLSQLGSGELLLGMHVQSISPLNGSEGYVNTQVPEPATLAMLGMGLLGLGAVRRRGVAKA